MTMCETPSECTHTDFIRVYSPDYQEIDKVAEYNKGTLKTGKWLIFINRRAIDEVWSIIKDATEAGGLGTDAKVATKIQADMYSERNSHLICVYTKDWKNKREVMRVRGALRKLGITHSIPYKADEDSLDGKYKNTTNGRISKYYA